MSTTGNCCGRCANAHINDWLDDPRIDEPYAKAFFEHARLPAANRDQSWLAAHPLFCTFEGERYRVTGTGRLGGVWLSHNFARASGYDHRARVNSCTNWSDQP